MNICHQQSVNWDSDASMSRKEFILKCLLMGYFSRSDDVKLNSFHDF